MTERSFSEQEVKRIAMDAASAALARQPVPSLVTLGQASEMLGVSIRTITRRNPPKGIGGKIPYEWIIAQRRDTGTTSP